MHSKVVVLRVNVDLATYYMWVNIRKQETVSDEENGKCNVVKV